MSYNVQGFERSCRLRTPCHQAPGTCRMNTSCLCAAAGNAVVQGVAVTQYGTAVHLPTWAARDVESLKLAADAKMRMAYRLFPSAVHRLHAWRLLTPLYNAVGALGRQVRSCSHTVKCHPLGAVSVALSTRNSLVV
jgi:hypothetical protein